MAYLACKISLLCLALPLQRYRFPADRPSSPGIAAAMLSSSQLIDFPSTTANAVTTMMPAPPMSFDNKRDNCNDCTTYSVDDNDLTTRRRPA